MTTSPRTAVRRRAARPAEDAVLTLGRLARGAGLARTSVLHYEKLGLLRPAGRSPAGYRLYRADAMQRLAAIRQYRAAGLTLTAIRVLLQADVATDETAHAHASGVLEQQLMGLSAEIVRLQAQQRRLARLLAKPLLRRRSAVRHKSDWVALLRRAGLSDADMRRWHAEFEAEDGAGHARFLRSLGIAPREVAAIRAWSLNPARRPGRVRRG